MSEKVVVLSNGITGDRGLSFFYRGDVVIQDVLGDTDRISKLFAKNSIRFATEAEAELDKVTLAETVRKTVEQNTSELRLKIDALMKTIESKDSYIRSLEKTIEALKKEESKPEAKSAKK